MSIESQADLDGLRAAGRVVARAIRAMRARVRPQISTRELDRIGARVFADAGARSAPQLAYGFPGVNCISVNDEAVHGIPGPRRLREGDLVSLDVTAELDGYYADACVTVPVGRAAPSRLRLIAAGQVALTRGIASARAGAPINDIGRAVQAEVTARGYAVCRELTGHGIGRDIHESPTVANYDDPGNDELLTPGLVITVEPIISAGSGAVYEDHDGWTVRTADRAASTHAEHTIVVTDRAPILITA